jgi:hypothetical protein
MIINNRKIVNYMDCVKFTGLHAKAAGNTAYGTDSLGIFAGVMGTTGNINSAGYGNKGK